MILPSSYLRPRAYEPHSYAWQPLPHTLEVNGGRIPHPVRSHAVFLVHGIGDQQRAETAATLRSGFEDALVVLLERQENESHKAGGAGGSKIDPGQLPPPFIYEGYWADYEDLKNTFPEKWRTLSEGERAFFNDLWARRTTDLMGTIRWFFAQQLRLLNPSIIWRIHLFAWLLYIPLQVVVVATLALAALRYRKAITHALSDVRLYVDPKGMIERAIVQRIDRRVGESFLRMIGLDWDLRPLLRSRLIRHDGKPIVFDRVTWVAHSLGTVISYNVLSDLFARARELEKTGDAKQKAGVKRFRTSFRRFVTLGSPLDKVAFLFGERSIRSWEPEDRLAPWDPSSADDARRRRDSGDLTWDWWVNFYHALDPVSGALSNELLCGDYPPRNYHIGLARLPGLAHMAYWRDVNPLKHILGRVYGKEILADEPLREWGAGTRTLVAMLGYFVWAGFIVGAAWFVVWYVWGLAQKWIM